MTLKCFQERGDSTQVLSRHFIRINTEGQQSVLLTSQLVAVLTLLIGKRAACGVQEGNPFLFAKPDSSPPSHFLGEDCVRSYSRSCQAGDPERLTSARFHKHAARMFQILNLEDDELGQLAKLLGRDVRADREYYQSPEAAAELAKISKLLLAMEKGSLERLEGNSLEELELEDPDGVPAKRRKEEESKEDIPEMMENAENRLRCPVRLYEFYLSKCSESVKQRTDLFYLNPERCCVPNSPLWFSSSPLDSVTMEAMLNRIHTIRELHLRTKKGGQCHGKL
ncbi:uncharacterized protein ACNS7B_021323 isoform 2-T2 [Menidia menidia]